MNVAQFLHELALIADVAVVVTLLPEDAAGNSQVSAQKRGANLGHLTNLGHRANLGHQTLAKDNFR